MSLQSTLVELGFSQQEAQEYCDLFRSHDITQNELMSLDHELLKEMGVTKIGHRIRLLKLKQMRDSLPTSYKADDAPKKTTTARKKKIAEPDTPPEPVETKPKRVTRSKRDTAASKSKAKLEDSMVLPEISDEIEEKTEESHPQPIVEPVAERPKPNFTLQSFDLPEDLIFGSSDSPKTPRQASIPYSLDEGFSLEIPSSFSKAMQNLPPITPTPAPTPTLTPVPTSISPPTNNTINNTNVEQDDEDVKKKDKAEKAAKEKKKEKEKKEQKKEKEREKEKEKKKQIETKKDKKVKETKQPIVTEPSDEADSEEDEASEQSLEEYINDEVMQIDPEEASALDFVLQNEANQEKSTDEQLGDGSDEEDDYMKILNDKVTQSLDGLNVKDIMKSTPNKLKQIVIDSFIDVTPRKHQWEAVYNIIRDILMSNYVSELDGKTDASPTIKNYLIQHSAGSGKSLTIACLVYMLYMLKDNNDKYKFDFILVLTDRKVLDEQLGKTVKRFLRANQVRTGIKQADKATDLNSLLVDNSKSRVLMSTVQKFGQLLTKNKLDKTIAIIADEAHRTHGRSSTRHVHEFLTGATRQSESITYFSFTCTPTPKALEMFGVKHGSTYSPFCTYSMEQALNDKVIMNVLEDYTSVAAIAQIEPSAMEAITKTYEKGLEATKTLMKATEDDRQVLREKAKYIVNHFVKKSKELSNEKFTAKGMLVTGSRKHIIWYKQEIETLIRALPEEDQFEVVAAFTSFTYEGKKVTQDDEAVNGDYAGKVLQQFKKSTSLVKLIIVADKLRTGFDEPKLAIMYIDRKLMGTNAVQTLGRLNRVAPGKESVSVVDFVNSRKQISEAFGQYWATTTLVDMSGRDPLQKKLDDVAQKLLTIEGIREKDLKKSVNAIIMEDFERKKQGARTVERELNSFTNMCDRLQIEHPDLPYKFAIDLKNALFVEYKSRLTKAREILSDISLRVDGLRLVNQGSIHVTNSGKDLRYNALGAKVGEISEPSMNVGQIVNTVNEANFIRLLQMKDNPKGMAIPLSVAVEEDFSNDNLEFAKGIWSRRQRPRSVSDMRKNKAAEVPTANTTAEEEKKLARDLESELLAMSNKVSNTNVSNPVKQLVPPATSSSFQIKKLLQQQNPRENFKPKIAGELNKSTTAATNTSNNTNVKDNSGSAPNSKPASPALIPQPAPVPVSIKEEHVPMDIDTPDEKEAKSLSMDLAALIAKNCPPSPAKRKIDQVDANNKVVGEGEPSEEPERKKQKTEPAPNSPPVIDLSTPPEPASDEPNEDPMDDHDAVHAVSSHEEQSVSRSGTASPPRTTNFTDVDKAKISAFLRMVETTKYNTKDRQKVLRALAGHAISDEAKNYMREINAIDLLVKEFLVPIAPNSVLGAAIYRSVEETACASSCLYELARDNKTNAELIAKKALGHIIGMLAQKSDLQISSTKLLAVLCVNDTLKQQIGVQSIPTLILLLNVPDEVVKNETARTLRIMCTLPANAQLIAERGGVPNLVNLMGAKQVNTCVMAIKTLHDLCKVYPKAIELVKAEKMIYRYMPKWSKSDVPKYKAKALALDSVLGLTKADYNAACKKWPELNAPLRRSNEPSSTTAANLTRSWENKTEPTPPTNVSELPQVVTVVRPVIITPPKVKAQPRTTPGSANPLTKSAEGLRVIVANQPPPKSPSKSSRGPPPSRGNPPPRDYSSRGPPPYRGRGGPPPGLRHSTGSTRDYYRGPSPSRSRPRYRRSRSRSRSRSRDRRSGPRSRSRDRYRRSRSRSRGRSRSWSRSRSRSRSGRSRSRSRDRNRYSRSRSRSLSRSRSRDRARSRDRK